MIIIQLNQNGEMLLIRPGCEIFLEELSKYYEIVVFTAAIQEVYKINNSMQILF